MRSVFFLFLTFVGGSTLLLFADLSGRFEVHATRAHAFVALPAPLIVDAVLAASSSDAAEIPTEIIAKSKPSREAVPSGKDGLPVHHRDEKNREQL